MNDELGILIERYLNFLSKLEERALELETETVKAGQEIIDLDEFKFIHFKAGITNQYDALKEKARDVFKEQLYKKSFSYHYSDEDVRANDYMYNHDQRIKQTKDLLDEFEYKIDSILENIFNKVNKVSAEEKLKNMLDEYEIIKNNFCCSQCGAKLKIEKVYFVSAYIKCEFCQTQNTFVPSTRMSLLPDLVREIATEKTGILDYPIPGNSVFEKFLNNEKHARQQFFIKKNLVPELTDSYKEIYKRELREFLLSFDEYQNEKNFKTNILTHFGVNYFKNNNFSDLDSEILLNIDLLKMNFINNNAYSTIENLEEYYQSTKN